MIRVLAVDDHPIVRRGLRDIVADTGDITLSQCVGTAHEAFRAVETGAFDVILLDIELPDMSGIDAVKQIHRDYPRLAILALTLYAQRIYAVRAIRAGASGYVTKDSAAEQLVTAIRTVHRGGKYITTSLAEELASAVSRGAEGPLHEVLSDREYQVFRMLAMGKTVTNAAQELGLSRQTVTTYRRRILDKMGMSTNSDLARYAIAQDLLSAM